MAFPFPGMAALLGIVTVLAFRYRHVKKKQKEDEESFWERENRADFTPKKDLSKLDYIKVPIDDFPLGQSDDPDICIIEDELSELATKPLLNLSRRSNTSLKLEFGAGNLKTMQTIADDYDRLVILLADYGKSLMEENRYDDAYKVLSFGREIGSDVSANETLLLECEEKLEIHRNEPYEDADAGSPEKDGSDKIKDARKS